MIHSDRRPGKPERLYGTQARNLRLTSTTRALIDRGNRPSPQWILGTTRVRQRHDWGRIG